MGVFRKIKGTIKKVGAFIVALPVAIKVVALLTIIVSASLFLADLYEMITAENTPKKIYEDLEIEDVAELIQIKGNKDTGYYLDFVDDIDTKLEALVETLNTDGKYHNVPTDIDFLKKLLQAEVVTKFPNLGGDIPEGESGFQGAIDVKRVTPNKEVGQWKNTGQGETTLLEPESSYTDVSLTPREEEIQSWEEGKSLVLYNDCYVYDEEDNVWIKREEDSKYVIIRSTDTVTYTGKYEKVEDKLNDIVTFYVEVKSGDITGYIQSKNINVRSSDSDEEDNQSDETATRQNVQVSSRAPEDSREKEIVGNENEEYIVAIAAGHNNTDDKGARNGDLIEEDLTIQVAERVEELINEKYENVTVVQTGSTSSNPGGIKKEDRTKLAREADPDLCIQIHFDANDSADANGVSVIYKDKDYYSQQLAEILAESISSSMGLTNRGDGPDTERTAVKNLSIIEKYSDSGFPSVVTEGGFVTGNVDADVIKNGNGVEKYAQGIVEGIKTYLESDHSGLTSTSDGTTEITTSIESRIVNMKYVTPEELEEMKNNGNVKEATKYFTLNEDNKLVTLTWVQNAEGNIEIKENAAMDFRTALQQYQMPFEYLLYYYIDTSYRDFSEKLADVVLDSEIVIALQDNVTTTQTLEDTETKVETSSIEGDAANEAHDWIIDHSAHTETITEVCTTKIDITYVETWCVKTYKDNSFSENVLNMGDRDEIIVNVPGQVTETVGEGKTGDEVIIQNTQKDTGLDDKDGNDIMYTYIEKQRIVTTTNTLRHVYNTDGDAKVEPVTNKYVDLYIEENMNQRMQEGWFFKIVENNERTANLLDLTKYLMFLASNTNYGVTVYDFDIFDLDNFQTISGSGSQMDLLVEYIHYFEHSTPPPTNADGTKYIIEDDGRGKPVVGYGVDVETHAEEFRQAGYPTTIGAEVDKEFVDTLEKREMQSNMEGVKSLTSGLDLTGYQINALVSRAYNCGLGGAITTNRGSPAMGFVASYNKYWNESDDQFEEKNPNADFSHDLYVQYMDEPVNGVGFGYMAGLETRRKSEWTLFQTGYYDVLDKWHTDGTGGSIIECAKTIHEYMEQNNYTYCVYGGNSYEECGAYGKSHGLNTTFEESKTGYHNTCCATYVSWVLQEAGYLTASEHTNSADSLTSLLISKGFIIITDPSELLPGDVLSYSGHVEIYAGDGTVYNAGSGNAIRSASPQTKNVSSMNMALRAPN